MSVVVLNKEESIIRDYFPNRRMPSSIGVHLNGLTTIDIRASKYSNDIETYCKLVWYIEARFTNRSNFIFNNN